MRKQFPRKEPDRPAFASMDRHLYAGDDLSGEWDHRNWMKHEIRERLFHLAAEACLKL